MKKMFLFTLMSLIGTLFSNLYPHGQGVHQHMVRQAYEIIKSMYGEDIPILQQHIGYNEQGNSEFNPGGKLVIGAHREDEEDVVYSHYGVLSVLVTNTHFWDPDGGDAWHFVVAGKTYQNAYQKALKYIYGGYELCVPYSGSNIMESYDAPSNLFQFYKDGMIFYRGYYTIPTMGFVNRGCWVESPQWLRDKIVWEILGRVCHLIGDMTVPAHVHGDPHPPLDTDTYEMWMDQPNVYNYYTYSTALAQGSIVNLYNISNPLKYIFYSTAQITNYFPSDDNSGNGSPFTGDSFSNYEGLSEFISTMNIQLGGPPNNVNPPVIANYTFNYGLRIMASFMNWFASEMNLIPRITAKNCFENGTIEVGFNSPPIQQSSPFSFQTLTGKTINLKAQNQTYQGIERVWNASGANSSISRWVKRVGTTFTTMGWNPYYSFVASTSDNNATYIANLKNNYRVDQTHATEFDGDIPQTTIWLVEQNNIQVSAPMQQTINGNNYRFAGWSDGNGDNPRTISPTNNETYTAWYKSPQYSNIFTTYENSSQRKFIRDVYGKLFSVYESMGKVWLEKSSNNGQTWEIINNGNPLSNANSKSPSLSLFSGSMLAITFQEEDLQTLGSKIKLMITSTYGSGSILDVADVSIESENYVYSEINLTPVVAANYTNQILLIWKDISSSYSGGFSYRRAQYNLSLTEIEFPSTKGPVVIDEFSTDEKSLTPTLVANNYTPYSNEFHLAWCQETENSSISHIYYCKLNLTGTTTTEFSNLMHVSSGSGFTKNYNPSMVDFTDGTRMCWIGTREYMGEKEEEEPVEGGETLLEHRVIFKDPGYYRYWNFIKTNGNTVHSPNINKTDNNSAYIFGWSEDNGTERLFANNSLNNIYTMVGTSGRDLQLSNGASTSSMYVNTFNNSTLPYSFASTVDINSFYGIQKSSGISISRGREGIVTKDSVQFYFCMGDISVDGESVEFVELPDTLNVNNQIVINQSVVSKPFDLTNNSNFLYGVQYGIANPSTVTGIINNGKSVGFKVELIDAESNAVIGVFDDVTYNENSLNNYDNLFYQVNTSGIGSRTVKLRLQINENLNADYSISDKYSKTTMFNKQSLKEVSYRGSLAVNEYALNQNYPNPFNPSTIISYQLEAGGQVSLKVYDILGNEIVTLVDKEQESGRYQVTFDASKLASGVYIGRIIAGDFVKTIKMSLVK